MSTSDELRAIAAEMRDAGVNEGLIDQALYFAGQDDGITDLLLLWPLHTTPEERRDFLKDLQGCINDLSFEI